MIGAIIGDVVGSTREFNNILSYRFKLFPRGSAFTDDTVCTIAVADAILRGVSYKESLLLWCRRYPSPMGGYGASFRQWWVQSDPKPYWSFGNGAAMRVSPVGWAFPNVEKVIDQARLSAKCSHDHPEGVLGATVVATAIYFLRKGIWKAKDLKELRGNYYPDEEYPLPWPGEWNETCQGCVPLALKIVAESVSFEDAIRNAVAYGGDSDTLAAIVGSMAEPAFGVPADLRKDALSFLPKEMVRVISAFECLFGK